MELEKIIENIEKTLEHNGYSLEDLKKELCDCPEEEGGYEKGESKEEKGLRLFNDRLEKIIDIEDKDEKIRELKKLLQEMKDKYKGTNPSKEVKSLYDRIRKALDAEQRTKRNRGPTNMIR